MHVCADPDCPGNLDGRQRQNPIDDSVSFQEAISPRDVTRAAENCPILYHCYQAWRAGVFTWEYAMMTAAKKLAEQNHHLQQELTEAVRRELPQRIVGWDGKTYVYTGPCPLCGHQPERKEDAAPTN